LTLPGWSQLAAPQDGVVLEDVARVLARAFRSTARGTFPCSAVKPAAPSICSPLDGDLVRAMDGSRSRSDLERMFGPELIEQTLPVLGRCGLLDGRERMGRAGR
jgi:hypothetical protein